MPVLFISHSSKDDAQTATLERWLVANGFTDIFVDHENIAGGDKWREKLRESAHACRVVVCLVSDNWLGSSECFNEFMAAWYMGRRIIPLFLLTQANALGPEARQRLARVCGEDQGIDLTPCLDAQGVIDVARDETVANRLSIGLRAAGANMRVGVDPEAFAIDEKLLKNPFPGLASFGDHDADAALFYGRSREIAETLIELRQMRANGDKRPLVVLGASGVGKSSLLKAGIIPRLRRETLTWLPLRAFRPGADPLLNFAEAISRTLADFGQREAHGVIRDKLLVIWSNAERDDKSELTEAGRAAIHAALEAEARRLRKATGRSGASILVSVDQAEEMARAGSQSGEALADYLRVALADTTAAWQLAFTIRTDSFPELQKHRRFQDLEARGYDLRAIPAFRFDSVVEQPARRYGVQVAPELVDVLMKDAPKEDSMPLLAFAMQRLWGQYSASGSLAEGHYRNVGGLKGLIEDAAERALRGLEPEHDTPLPSAAPPKRLIDLGASTFVPALAQINDEGVAMRRVTEWQCFNEEQQDLLMRFDRWRLVVRKGTESAASTVELAHETLFREWTRLKSWLEPERARLEALRSLQVDAAAWERSGKDDLFLNHRERRLAEVEGLTQDGRYRQRMVDRDLEYIAACHRVEEPERPRLEALSALQVDAGAWERSGKEKAFLNHRERRLVEAEGLTQDGPYRQRMVDRDLEYIAACRRIEQAVRARRGNAVNGTLLLLLILVGMGWWNHAWLYKQYHWPLVMRPTVLTPEQERALQPKAEFSECRNGCPTMVVVPGGKFLMGSLKGNGDSAEQPQHEVTISKPFAIGKYELTFAEWDRCVADGGCAYRPGDQGWGRDKRPVINISWNDAQEYVAWLSEKTGKTYRLLSEAEWEYAARASSNTTYPWGNEIGKGHANCDGCGSQWDNKQTAPVGSFPANRFGLHEMNGNVWEWLEDCYQDDYSGAPTDASARMSADCSRRVLRGGAWGSNPRNLSSVDRFGRVSPHVRSSTYGLRVGRTLAP